MINWRNWCVHIISDKYVGVITKVIHTGNNRVSKNHLWPYPVTKQIGCSRSDTSGSFP